MKLPETIRGIVKCANPACVSNSNEPVQSKFYVEEKEPLLLKRHYWHSKMAFKNVESDVA